MSWHPTPPAPPSFDAIKPMLPDDKATAALDDPNWIYEIKYDGYRVTACVDDGKVQLRSRSGADCTNWFPEVAQGLASLPGGPHVLDGEVCAVDEHGRSAFGRLQDRARRRRRVPGAPPAVFCVFDLLTIDGRTVMDLPVEQRKQLLGRLLASEPPCVEMVSYYQAMQGQDVLRRAAEMELNELVAKRLGSRYVPGVRSADWVKCKRALDPA